MEMPRLVRIAGAIAIVLVVALASIKLKFGDGKRLADRSTEPSMSGEVLETVVDLDYPPGNIAVSEGGRIFFTLHPDGRPPTKVHELVGGEPVPYPNLEYQSETDGIPYFQSILAIRIDRQNRLWVLDFAEFGRGTPRISAFDLATNELVHTYDFPPEVAGLASMLNDFQVSPDGGTIYIAETSPLVHSPALIVYDVNARESRRLLSEHESVLPQNYVIQAPGRDMIIYGIYNMRIGVDSIALDRKGEWLYYGSVTGDTLYRIKAADLSDASLTYGDLAGRVEAFADKTLSDGITTDVEGNVYLSDMENSAIHIVTPERELKTLIKDERLRWPDGFSFGPGGDLYVTCSSLQNVLFVGSGEMRANAPYQIYRFSPGPDGIAGH
jgi:sugar lactone lactonase YvrE